MLFFFNLITLMHSSYYLSKNIVPTNYNITLAINKQQILGITEINLKIKNKTKQIELNAEDMEITQCKIRKNKEIAECNYEMQDGILKIFGFAELDGEVDLILQFESEVRDNMEGIYRSDYSDGYVISTHFEAIAARKAFPCFDQPNLKATFKIGIVAESKFVVLSNMRKEKTKEIANSNLYNAFYEANKENDNFELKNKEKKENNMSEELLNYTFSEFRITPIMSTYLVAFVIGDLEFEEEYVLDTRVRVYGTIGNKAKSKYALKVACESLNYMINYFEVGYPLDKLDLVGIPEFSMGAMENWGLVTFRTTSLFYSEETSSIRAKELVAGTVVHELVHQWFGNLVTPETWDHLWLNESFATALSAHIMEQIKSVDWNPRIRFIGEETFRGLELDSLSSTHPIQMNIKNLAEIDQTFDEISYSKGAAVLNMLIEFINGNVFQQNISKYLKKFAYKNATSDDLWETLGNSVKSMMNNWTKNQGYPFVKIFVDENKIVLEQEQFLTSRKTTPTNILWKIPLFVKNEEKESKMLMETKRVVLSEKLENLNNLFINNKGSSFFRTLYIPFPNFKLESISDENKLVLLNDTFNFAESGLFPLTEALKFAEKFFNEKNYDILNVLYENLNYLRDVFDEKRKEITQIIFKNLENVVVDLNTKPESVNEMHRMSLILGVLVNCRHEKTVKRLANAKKYEPIYRSSVYRAIVINGEIKENNNKNGYESDNNKNMNSKYSSGVNQIFSIYDKYNSDEKTPAIHALGMSNSDYELLLHELYGNRIKLQDKIYFASGLTSNSEMQLKAVNFLIDNFKKIKESFRNNKILLSYLIESFLSSAVEKNLLQKCIDFFEKEDISGIENAVKKGIEKASNSVEMKERGFNFEVEYYKMDFAYAEWSNFL